MTKHTKLRNLASGTALIAGIIGVGVGVTVLQQAATAQQDMIDVPMFEVDPLWPKVESEQPGLPAWAPMANPSPRGGNPSGL